MPLECWGLSAEGGCGSDIKLIPGTEARNGKRRLLGWQTSTGLLLVSVCKTVSKSPEYQGLVNAVSCLFAQLQ